jgi:Protein of unknown function (DUF2975)
LIYRFSMLLFFDMKTRSLAMFDAVLLLVIGLTGLVVLLNGIQAVADDRISEVTVGLADDAVRAALPDDVTLQDARALVEAEVGTGWRLLWWGVGAAMGAVVIAGAEQLRAIVASARAGDPFVTANVRRLRIAGTLALIHSLLSGARIGVDLLLQDHLGTERAVTGNGGYQVALAVVLFAVAEIWQRGVFLRDEQELTV